MLLFPPSPGRRPRDRRGLSADGLYAHVRSALVKIPDHRSRTPTIPLVDAPMSSFAMFWLKDLSLLAFEARRPDENMKPLFCIGTVSGDTQMRGILGPVDPLALRPAFLDVFRDLQRDKALEPFVFSRGHDLIRWMVRGILRLRRSHVYPAWRR